MSPHPPCLRAREFLSECGTEPLTPMEAAPLAGKHYPLRSFRAETFARRLPGGSPDTGKSRYGAGLAEGSYSLCPFAKLSFSSFSVLKLRIKDTKSDTSGHVLGAGLPGNVMPIGGI